MCFALPMRSISIQGGIATISAEGLEQRAGLGLADEPPDGDAGGA
jgi:hydrogenase maturation factor